MRATPELVWALRRAAKRILDPAEGYSWSNSDKCNCGLLVRELCGLTEKELFTLRYKSNCNDSWSGIAKVARSCQTTGLPIAFVFDTLEQVGLGPEDFHYLEMSGPGNFGNYGFNDARNVSAFFEHLANQLEAQLSTNCTKREDFACTNNDTQAPCAHETNSPTEPAGARANAATNSTGTGQPASVAACATVRTSRPAQTEQGAAQ